MSLLDDVQTFLEDLVLGDFAENPSSISIVVNGAIGLIPVVDQLLDVRDVAGVIVRCNRQGWNNLQPDDHVDLAFAALGCVPELGSFLKGAVKPLYKNRQAAGKGVQAGLAMMERAFGMGKGGVVKWLKALNWAQNTQQAIQAAQDALALYAQVLQAIAAQPWWAPSGLVSLARRMQPGIKTANAHLDHPIRQGSKLIQDFVQELLGENAVYAQAALQVASSNAHQGKSHRPRQVHAAAHSQAVPKRQAKTIAQEKHPELHGSPRGHAASGNSISHHAVQFTRDKLQQFVERPMGLVAEHMVDYHVLHAEGSTHTHGSVAEQQGAAAQKLLKVNAPHRPVELTPIDLTLLTTSGIDSLWKRGAKYLVVEAKGRIGAPSTKTGKAAKDSTKSDAKIPPLPQGHPLTPEQAQLWRMLHDNTDKATDSREMQMSHAWIKKDLQWHQLASVRESDYERRVYLVAQFPTPAQGIAQHIEAIGEALANGRGEVNPVLHQDAHGISVVYLEKDIAAVEGARSREASRSQQSQPSQNKPPNPEKVKQTRKGRTR